MLSLQTKTPRLGSGWELNGYCWQDGEFKTAFDALRRIRKPVHPDDARAQALHSLLYETEPPRQEQLIGRVAIGE